MDLSIIIVNYNSKDYLKKCIDSILANTSGISFEIIVVDSASYDGCGEMLRSQYPDVRFIQSSENVGFAKANNLAFRNSCGESLLFLNPDTEVIGRAINILHSRLHALRDAGVVGCRLLNTDQSVQNSCIMPIPTILNQVLDSEYLRARWPNSDLWGTSPLQRPDHQPAKVEVISGACMMLRRCVFEGVGHFSGEYFMYTEDVDLCYKIMKAGYHNYYISDATMIHHGGISSKENLNKYSIVMLQESIWRFIRKTRNPAYAVSYRATILLAAVMRIVVIHITNLIIPSERDRDSSRYSLDKWYVIIRWCINKEIWVKSYR